MKNLIIGFMLGVWSGPVLKEVVRRQIEKSNARNKEAVTHEHQE